MFDKPETLTRNKWAEQISVARSELTAANVSHHRAREVFDNALDAYIEERDRYRAAVVRLDYLESFTTSADDPRVVVRRP